MVALLACAAPDLPPSDSAAPAVDTGAPELGPALEALLDSLVELNGAQVLASYTAAASPATDTCPAEAVTDGVELWHDDCETDDGTRFVGTASTQVLDDRFFDEPDFTVGGEGLFASAAIEGSDGTTWYGAGIAQHAHGTAVEGGATEGGATVWRSLVQGVFHASAGDGWLAETLSADLELRIELGADDQLALEGGVGGLSGALSAVRFEGFTAERSCAAPPGGQLALRDAAGHWYELTPGCDGCGELVDGDGLVDTVCIDPGALWSWDQPW